MKKLKLISFIAVFMLLMTGCGSDSVIGTVYGDEHEYISIGNDTYTVCYDDDFDSSDRNKKLGTVVFDDKSIDPMTVYTVKGCDDNEYIYTLWLYDGAFYKKDSE